MTIGFTLAETLITLGIIGVVAALTIPTLVGNYQKKTAAVRLKKFYSAYSQALQFSEMEHGDISTWNHMEAGLFGEETRNISFFNEYLYKYMKPAAICVSYPEGGKTCGSVDITHFGNRWTRVLFQDGSCAGIFNTTTNNDALSSGVRFSLVYDINCTSGPNKEGRDMFYFRGAWGIDKTNNSNYYPLAPYSDYPVAQLKNKTRDELKERCIAHKVECSALIKYDNWEIKDDYPW